MFNKNIKQSVEQCLRLPDSTYNFELILQKIIASEALKYLSSPPSQPVFKVLINYCIYKCCHSIPSQHWQLWLETNPVDDILLKLKETVLNTNWLSAFARAYEHYISLKPSYILQNYLDKYLLKKQSSPTFSIKYLTVVLQLESSTIYLKRNDKYSKKRLTKLARITKITLTEDEKLIIEWALIDDKRRLAPFQNIFKEISEQVEELIKSALKINISVVFKLNEESVERTIAEYEKQRAINRQKAAEYARQQEEQLKREEAQRLALIQREKERQEAEKARIERIIQLIKSDAQRYSTLEPDVMVECQHCKCRVKKQRYFKHLIKAHQDKYA